MTTKGLTDRIAESAVERVAGLLADRVADKVVTALMSAGFDKKVAQSLLRSFEEQLKDSA